LGAGHNGQINDRVRRRGHAGKAKIFLVVIQFINDIQVGNDLVFGDIYVNGVAAREIGSGGGFVFRAIIDFDQFNQCRGNGGRHCCADNGWIGCGVI